MSNLTTSKEFSETRSTLFKTSLSISSSTWRTTSNYVANTTSQVRRRSSILLITANVPQSTSSKLHSLSSASFPSIAVSDDSSLASHVSPSKISSQSLIFFSTGNHSFSQTQTSESHISSHVYSSVFESANFSSPAKPFTSSILLDVSSLLASDSTALGPNYSTSATSLMPRSPTMSTSSNKLHLSTSSVMSPIQTISSVSLLASPRGPHSSVATSAAHVPSSQYSSVSKSATDFSLVKSSRSSAVSISTTILAQTKVTGTTAMTSGLKSSTANISVASSQSSFSQSSQSTPSLKLSILSQSKILKSLKMTTVRPSLSEQFISGTKTSQMKSHNTLTKISSFNTKEAAVSSASVINNIFIQFDGKLVLSPKSSFKKKHNLKIFADSIENVLDTALNQANGFLYSKVLVITQSNEDKYDCMFQIIMRKSTSETAATLQGKINSFNQTNGFGHFMLHSVETKVLSSDDSSAETSLYLWAIIVIAALGVLCFLLLVAFICTQVCSLFNCSYSITSANVDIFSYIF